ncbi:MAG TPA: hypothetical protein VFE62_24385 [Gemmataceae bacterium]|nr:hypothetical protein [Gemmataceae bacterium]
MTIQELPFLHFMVRFGAGRNSHLVAPMEAEDAHSGGSFVAPLAANGRFFPVYRFHFAIYLGQGEFVKDNQTKMLFNGLAIATLFDRREHLLFTFELPGPEPWWPFEFWPRLPRVLRHHDEFYLPYFRRVPRRGPVLYGGGFHHQDFKYAFAEIEPTEPKILDEILNDFLISLIGCDPHTKYERKQG